MRKDMNDAETYEDIVIATPTCDHRSKEEYDRLIKICSECGPDGRCKMCGCRYEHKLALKHFYCGLGKFTDED